MHAPLAVALASLLLFVVAAGAATQAITTDLAAQRNAEAQATTQAAQSTAQAAQVTRAAQLIQATVMAVAAMGPTATAEARAVEATRTGVEATAQSAQSTVLALSAAAPTATAEARAVAAARSVQATVVAELAGAERIYALDDGRLEHRENTVTRAVLTESAFFTTRSVALRNFMVGVRFYNPYDPSEHPWDYGIGFRSGSGGDGYRLCVDSSGNWHLELSSGGRGGSAVDQLKTGKLSGARLSRNGSNYITLIARGDTALFLLNGEHVATLDLSEKKTQGELWIGTGFARGNTLAGRSTCYQDFRVWALPE